MVNEISMMTIFVVSLCDKNKAEVWIKHLNNPLKQGNSFQNEKPIPKQLLRPLCSTNDQLQPTTKSANNNTSQFRAAIDNPWKTCANSSPSLLIG